MKKQAMIYLVIILCICLQENECRGGPDEPIFCYAGLTDTTVFDVSKLKPYQADSLSGFSGVYAFGQSKAESYLLVVMDGDRLVVQHQKKRFNEAGSEWTRDYQTPDPVAVDGHRIVSPGWDAEFAAYIIYSDPVLYNTNLVSTPYPVDRIRGLLIHESPLGIKNEFGVRIENGLDTCPRSSAVLLTESDIQGKTSAELKIMRNEIFARYGYRFKPGGAMDRYFRAREWYLPMYDDVFEWLTEIEKANIEFIRAHE